MTPLDQATARIRHLESENADLKDTVAYQARELVLRFDADLQSLIRHYLKLTPSEAWVLTRLYQAKRFLSAATLFEDLPAKDHTRAEERDPNIVKIMVHRIRNALGDSVIESLRTGGYRISPTGIVMVDAASRGESVPAQTPRNRANPRRFNPSEVRAIRASPETSYAIAVRLGISPNAIYRIRQRTSYKDVP